MSISGITSGTDLDSNKVLKIEDEINKYITDSDLIKMIDIIKAVQLMVGYGYKLRNETNDSMKIALLNLPFDNNYGGNLQRYALIKVLQDMGHEVEHINLRTSYSPSHLRQLGRWFKRILKIVRGEKVDFFYEKHMRHHQKLTNRYAEEFYSEYIPHTNKVFDVHGLMKVPWDNYEIALVGSDQVWRYDMAQYSIGIKNFFFSFIEEKPIRKIAYSISLGTYENCDIKRYKTLGNLYKKFFAVSFRETAAIEYAGKIGWRCPNPIVTLDPTLLLYQEDYIKIFSLNRISEKYVFIYILDDSKEKNEILSKITSTINLPQKKCSLKGEDIMPITEWLNSIMNAVAVVTDSYHGVVFSILFRKKLFFIGNERRGNERINSLLKSLHLKWREYEVGYSVDTQNRLEDLREKSLSFLNNSINGVQESFKD